ncbi:EamA family transporter [Streptomyces sp. NPDC004596]|uniref:EamA family transporter n=1 Tax=Streptomyces sp. DSM 118148 TaxID=3448667 RepID=UPI00404014D8
MPAQVVLRLAVAAALFQSRASYARGEGWNGRKLVWLNAACLIAAFWTFAQALALGVSPTVATALVYLYPVWYTLLMSPGQRPTVMGPRSWAAVAAAVLGAVLTTEFWRSTGSGRMWWLGAALALANGLLLALTTLIARKSKAVFPDTWQFTRRSFEAALLVCLAVAACVVLIHPALVVPEAGQLRPSALLLVPAAGILCTAAPYLLLYVGAARSRAATDGVWLLSEPLVVAVVAVWGQPESLDPAVIAGAVCIVAAAVVLLNGD